MVRRKGEGAWAPPPFRFGARVELLQLVLAKGVNHAADLIELIEKSTDVTDAWVESLGETQVDLHLESARDGNGEVIGAATRYRMTDTLRDVGGDGGGSPADLACQPGGARAGNTVSELVRGKGHVQRAVVDLKIGWILHPRR